MKDIFDLSNRTVLITGGAGLMGRSHTEAIIERGGRVIIGDIDYDAAFQVSRELNCKYNLEAQRQIVPVYLDVLDKNIIHGVAEKFPNINVLINNASKNPTVEDGSCLTGHFETMGVEDWREGIETALTGTFLCSQVFCNKFAKFQKKIAKFTDIFRKFAKITGFFPENYVFLAILRFRKCVYQKER